VTRGREAREARSAVLQKSVSRRRNYPVFTRCLNDPLFGFAFCTATANILQCSIDHCRVVAGAAAEWSVMRNALVLLRKWTAIPAVKYSLIAIAGLLWLVGFADQLPDVTQTAKYVGISLLMVAVAAIA